MSSQILREQLRREFEEKIRKIRARIEEFKRKYGMDFQEFFNCVESFSCLQRLMEKFDIEEVLRDSLEWEELEEELDRLDSDVPLTGRFKGESE